MNTTLQTDCKPTHSDTAKYWRPRPESNRGARICSPLRHHSATWPKIRKLKHLRASRVRTHRETAPDCNRRNISIIISASAIAAAALSSLPLMVWPYTSRVIDGLLWPSRFDTVRMSTPARINRGVSVPQAVERGLHLGIGAPIPAYLVGGIKSPRKENTGTSSSFPPMPQAMRRPKPRSPRPRPRLSRLKSRRRPR